MGSSICGGSAIAATAPVIDADDEDVAQSISVIFLFNILAALIFPTLGYALGFGTEGFAVFAGTAVNDTSSVTATAATAENLYHASGILSAAVTVKLTRTLAIIPITLGLALYRTRKAKISGGDATDFPSKKSFHGLSCSSSQLLLSQLSLACCLKILSPHFTMSTLLHG